MNTLSIVKSMLNEPIPDDATLLLLIEEVAQTITTYINQEEIPQGLNFVHANMVVDLVSRNTRVDDTEDTGTVSSITEGDVTVQFKTKSVEAGELHTQGLLFNYTKQLNKFRKIRW